MQKAVGDTPFLTLRNERDGIVIQPYDLTAALLLFTIQEAHRVANGHLLTAQPMPKVLPNMRINPMEVDRGILNQPEFPSLRSMAARKR